MGVLKDKTALGQKIANKSSEEIVRSKWRKGMA